MIAPPPEFSSRSAARQSSSPDSEDRGVSIGVAIGIGILLSTQSLGGSAAFAAPPPAGTTKVVVHKIRDSKGVLQPAPPGILTALGIAARADYAAFVIGDLPIGLAPGLRSAAKALGYEAELAPEFDLIRLQSSSFDVRSVPPAPTDPRFSFAPGEEPTLWIVQFAGPVKSEWRKQAAMAQVSFVVPLPENAALVRASSTAAAQLAQFPWVQATIPFEPAWRVAPSLFDRMGATDLLAQAIDGSEGDAFRDLLLVPPISSWGSKWRSPKDSSTSSLQRPAPSSSSPRRSCSTQASSTRCRG